MVNQHPDRKRLELVHQQMSKSKKVQIRDGGEDGFTVIIAKGEFASE